MHARVIAPLHACGLLLERCALQLPTHHEVERLWCGLCELVGRVFQGIQCLLQLLLDYLDCMHRGGAKHALASGTHCHNDLRQSKVK